MTPPTISQLDKLLAAGDLDGARIMLQDHVQRGEIIDPRIDSIWSPLADRIFFEVQEKLGYDKGLIFWEELLDFFQKTIEPVWGHAHKGHILFRLGFLYIRRDVSRARQFLEEAYKEDFLLEKSRGGNPEEVEYRTRNYSAYVALAILDRVDESDFDGEEDKRAFLSNIFGPAFDAAIRYEMIRPDRVTKALAEIVNGQGISACREIYQELEMATTNQMTISIISLTGTSLEAVLLSLLQQRDVSAVGSKGITEVELGPLFKESVARSVFPSPAVQAAMRLVCIFRNRLHPGNEARQRHKLTPRVALTVKNLFDHAIMKWNDRV